jgi:hypothetical protein
MRISTMIEKTKVMKTVKILLMKTTRLKKTAEKVQMKRTREAVLVEENFVIRRIQSTKDNYKIESIK